MPGTLIPVCSVLPPVMTDRQEPSTAFVPTPPVYREPVISPLFFGDRARPRRYVSPWTAPVFYDGAYVAPREAWGSVARIMANGIWIFVLLGLLFMITLGGPRY